MFFNVKKYESSGSGRCLKWNLFEHLWQMSNMRNGSTPDLHDNDSVQYSSSYITCTLRAKWNFRNSLLSKVCVQFPKTSSRKDLDFGGSLQYILFCDALLLSLAVFESHQLGLLWLVAIHQSDNQKWHENSMFLPNRNFMAYEMKCMFWWVTKVTETTTEMLHVGTFVAHLGYRAVVYLLC